MNSSLSLLELWIMGLHQKNLLFLSMLKSFHRKCSFQNFQNLSIPLQCQRTCLLEQR
uniref:Alternative protein FAT1 n=1 Tax=Homo sapiens TaxID=9606 RepID=L8E7S1_HUMAN|nr:alternative protein FAT1 [Homo sapiens]